MKVYDKEEYHITSVSKFLEIKDQQLYTTESDPGSWIFRGESDFTYPLRPSIGRLLNKGPFPTLEKLLKFEQSAFNEFRVSVYNDLREIDQFILLAVAQHHGLKTRLLDWTHSPLIALFFAVENEFEADKAGSILTLQAGFSFNDYDKTIKSPFHQDLEEYHFLFMPDLSPRIRAQQGVFQLFKNPTQACAAEGLKKYCIPSSSKRKIKRELNDLGISYQTIFPDLNGLCQAINYRKLDDKL